MPENILSILLGVVSGVCTAFLLFLVSRLVNNSFLPWYRQVMYKGVHLEGKWFSYSALLQKVVLEINQQSDQISGKLTAILESDDDMGIDTVRTFDVIGNIKDRFITLNLYHTDKTRIGVATILLQVEGDGTFLNGKLSSYSAALSRIVSNHIGLYRSEVRAKEGRKRYLEARDRESIDMESFVEDSGFFSDEFNEDDFLDMFESTKVEEKKKTEDKEETENTEKENC